MEPSATDPATDELADAWREFTETLVAAGRTIVGPIGATDTRERAEGFRHLTRILSLATEMLMEKGDPAHPEFTRWMTPHRKIMGDNPGTIYDAAMLDSSHTYRIRGNRGECIYLGVCLYGTGDNGSRRIAGNADRELGETFDLWISAERPSDLPQGAVHLPMPADVTDVLVRQYFHAPGTDAEASYTIECLGSPAATPPPTPPEVAANLRRTGAYVRDLIEVEATLSAISALTAPESIRPGTDDGATAEVDWDVVNRVQPTPAVGYAGAWFSDLNDDEAIELTGTLPECDYASVQWLNRWMESGDYRFHPVLLTDRELDLDAQRRFRVTLAHRDPRNGPWLDTTGLRNGTLVVRTIGAAESAPAEVEYRRITLL